ncbi:hypothetical protein GCM10010517_13750 [Streptosporangium fragile]|uniref:Uncharacterized protein n=2 Tax=Streptosporangium fragile TaxID=46186 RepID=A0ABN3VV58_9ACTN
MARMPGISEQRHMHMRRPTTRPCGVMEMSCATFTPCLNTVLLPPIPDTLYGIDHFSLMDRHQREGWGLLSFVRSQKSSAEIFQRAQDHYFRTECEISLDIETHVYRKPAGAE